MSEENVDIVRRTYDAWNRRDFEAAAALLAPDVEWRMPANLPDVDTWRGVDEVVQGLEAFLESWDRLEVDVHEYIDAGDKVVAVLRYEGRAAVTGLELQGAAVDSAVWTICGGKVAKVEMYGDTGDALEAAGLRRERDP